MAHGSILQLLQAKADASRQIVGWSCADLLPEISPAMM